MRNALIFSILAFCLGTSPVHASDFHSPRTAALGGAGHAGPLLNDSIYLNPSYTSFLPAYSMSGNFTVFKGPETAREADRFHGRHLNLSVVDGKNEMFQAGAGYTAREDGALIHLGASKAIISQLGFGLAGKYYFNTPGKFTGKDMVASMTGAINKELQAALVIDNLFESKDGKTLGMYREYTLGLKYNVDGIVLIYFDPHWTPTLNQSMKYGHEAGLEFPIMSDFFLRMGLYRNSAVTSKAQHGRGYGLGGGWIAPRLSIDYGLERVLEPGFVINHTFGMTVFF